jgi:hypothetical protein
MLIGYSVSFCIRDILLGEVEEQEVVKIVGNTKAQSLQDWEEVVAVYRKSSWYDNPELGEAILWRLVADNKIDQPRVRGEAPPIQQRIADEYNNPYWQEV